MRRWKLQSCELDMINKEIIKQLYEDLGGHGFNHVERVHKLSMKIAEKEKNIDLQIIDAAAWLHDIGSIIYGREDHHITGAKIAEEKAAEVKEEEAVEKPAETKSSSASTQTVSSKININTSSAAELDKLPGIGPTYAQRIIDYRDAHGGFKSISEIQNVKGIGPKTFEKLKDMIEI